VKTETWRGRACHKRQPHWCLILFFLHDVKPSYLAMAESHTPPKGLKRSYEPDSVKCDSCRAKKTKVRRCSSQISQVPSAEFSFYSATHEIEIGQKEKSAFRVSEADRTVDQMFPSVRAQPRLTPPTLSFSYREQQPSNIIKTSPQTLPLMTGRRPPELSRMWSLQMWDR
jgi:hypothetical protein